MTGEIEKIAFGGGCHWCTEAVFQALIGVEMVEQGWVSSTNEDDSFSEAVIVHFNQKKIPLSTLIKVHLRTHKSTSAHSMRGKYRSAIYTFYDKQMKASNEILNELQPTFKDKIITKIIPFKSFKPSQKQFQNYYKKNPEKPFCKTYIDPKLTVLRNEYSNYFREK